MAIKNFQVTIGATVTPFIAAGNLRTRWFVCVNNDAHAMAVGGSNTAVGAKAQGIPLAVGGSNYQGWTGPGQTNLAYWYVAGTQNDVLNVIYDDGNDAND